MPSATYDSGDICVCFSAPAEPLDYGIGPTHQVELDFLNLEIDSLTILGETVDFDSLPRNLRAAIRDLARDLEFN